MKNLNVTAVWDELRDTFEESRDDEIAIENINARAEEYLDAFLNEGYDATQIAEMLSAEATLKNYDKLTSAGANINLVELFDPDYVFDHVEEFIAKGCSAEDIVKKYHQTDDLDDAINQFSDEFWPDMVEFVCKLKDSKIMTAIYRASEVDEGEGASELMEAGASPKDMLESLKANTFTDGSNLREILEKIEEGGVTKDEVDKWLKAQDFGEYAYALESIIEDDEWKNIINDREDFIDIWIARYGKACLGDWQVELPKNISDQRFVDHFSIDEIMEMYDDDIWKDSFDFIDTMDFDRQAFYDRFKKEIGDPRNDKDLDLLNNLAIFGIDTGMMRPEQKIRVDCRAPGVIFIWFDTLLYPVEKEKIDIYAGAAVLEKKFTSYDISHFDDGDVYVYYDTETTSVVQAMTSAQTLINEIKRCYEPIETTGS